MSSFNYYPHINYNDHKAKFILAHAQVKERYLKDYRTFFSYVIKNEERPDIVAWNEYKDPTLDWVIYIINGIFDPYKDWPLSEKQFITYLETKYDMPAYKLQSVSDNSTIAYYHYTGLENLSPTDKEIDISNFNYTMSPETHDQLIIANTSVWNSFTQSYLPAVNGWRAKSIYDYEYDKNESKRDIILLRPNYIDEFKRQFRDLFLKV